MMRANDYIDVLIPRGGAGLIQAIVKNATVPVIETGTGNCHLYVDETAELSMAVSIADNGKRSGRVFAMRWRHALCTRVWQKNFC